MQKSAKTKIQIQIWRPPTSKSHLVLLAHRGLHLNSHSVAKYMLSAHPKRRQEFIQPIILFLVQSIGKYQIPRDLTVILLRGIKIKTLSEKNSQNSDITLSWTIGVSLSGRAKVRGRERSFMAILSHRALY